MSKASLSGSEARAARYFIRDAPRRGGLTLIEPRANLVTQANEEGSASEQFLCGVIDACASNVAVLDQSGRTILYASEAWRLFEQTWLFGNEENNSAGFFEQLWRSGGSISDAASDAATLRDDIDLLSNGHIKELHGQYSYRGFSGTGSLIVHAARLTLPNLGFRILITHRDVFSPQEALRKSERRLSQLLDTTNIVAWEANPANWRFTYVSDQAAKMLGYPIATWYARGFFVSRIHPVDRQVTLDTCLDQAQVADNFDLTFRMLAADGRSVWIHNLVSVTRENGTPVAVQGFMIDITERRRTQEALRDLGGRLIAAQEEERSRVARELHDDLNQRLALLSIELEQLGAEIRKSNVGLHRIHKLRERVREISTDIHRLSYKLHPSKLDHLGLAPAIASLCTELSEGQELTVEFTQTGFPAKLSPGVTLCIFRIAQEALRNCVKHSGANLARVILENKNTEIRLSISDDGCGFDITTDSMQRGLGFTSMRERLRLVDGTIDIRSQPRQGTLITVSVPLIRREEPFAQEDEFSHWLRNQSEACA